MTVLQIPLFLILLAGFPLQEAPSLAARPDARDCARTPAHGRVLTHGRDALALGKATLTLELPDGRRTIASRTRFASTRPGGFTWIGTLASDPEGYVAIAAQDDAVVGTVLERGVLSRIRATADGHLLLEERPSQKMHGCNTDEVPGLAPLTPALQPTPASSTSLPAVLGVRGTAGGYQPFVADLLIVWTQAAEDAAGGPAAIQALADLAVAETNMILYKSLATLRVRLVHSTFVTYVESSDMAVDLDRLQQTSDGILDDVHTLRDLYGADIVSLFVANETTCGRSFDMSPASAAFAPWAFTVVAQDCATGEYALAHELGHTFGLGHDRVNAYAPPSHPFAHGFWLPNGVFRTVMALPRWGVTGVRIPYYSTPHRKYLNQHLLGVPHPSVYSSDCSLALDLNTSLIVNWRPTTVP